MEVEGLSIGENIRRIRESRQITQVWLAEKVGISQAMLCQIERGTKNPSLQVGRDIANILNCKIDDLLA